MHVLVTGSEGHIGRVQVATLIEAGYRVRTFDQSLRQDDSGGEHVTGDLRDIAAVRRAVQGVDAVAHLGAIADDWAGHDDDVLAVNVQGTWNVLLACVEAGIRRLVYFSSINALGAVGGRRPPAYFPLDDAYPCHPLSPYQLSKYLAEEACRSYSAAHGLVTMCLRPVWVCDEDTYAGWPGSDPDKWAEEDWAECWAYVDVRDVCAATLCALEVERVRHGVFLLSADDTTAPQPTTALVDRYYPDVPWPHLDRAVYLANQPHRTLIDTTAAREILGWQPRYSWREHITAPPD